MPDSAARAAGRPEGLGRNRRLRSSALFSDAYRQGKRKVGRYMVAWIRTGPDAALRLGVVTSRKVGGAVARNRARRRLRDVFRRNREGFRTDVDVVLVARRGADSAPFHALRDEWLRLARQAGLQTRTGEKQEEYRHGPSG